MNKLVKLVVVLGVFIPLVDVADPACSLSNSIYLLFISKLLTIFFYVHIIIENDFSCAGRCGKKIDSLPCQCNTRCVNYGDCCDDYNKECSTGIIFSLPGQFSNGKFTSHCFIF